LVADASFSPCARVAASSARSAATVFSRVSVRVAAAGSGTGLPTFGSSPATRAVSASMAVLSCGAGGAEAGWIAGQPSIEPTPITSAAATAPETGATIQGETGRDGGSATAGFSTEGSSTEGSSTLATSGAASATGSGAASAEPFVSLDTSVAL